MNKSQNPPRVSSELSAEVRSGFFVVLSCLVFFGLLFVSGQSQWIQGAKSYYLNFNYIGGLTENSPVHLAGHKVGKVSKIEFVGLPEAVIRVEIAVKKNALIRRDSAAYVDAMGFMGEKFIELTHGTPESSVLEENGTLQGTDPMPMMELVKKGTELMEQFERSADAMNGLVGDLKILVGNNTDELDGTIKNVHDMSLNLKDMTHDLKLHPWKLLRKSKPPKEEKEEPKNTDGTEEKEEKKKRFKVF